MSAELATCGAGCKCVPSTAAAALPAAAASSAAAAPMVQEGWLCSAGLSGAADATAGGSEAGATVGAGMMPPALQLPAPPPFLLLSLLAAPVLRPRPSSCASEERMQ